MMDTKFTIVVCYNLGVLYIQMTQDIPDWEFLCNHV
jgi:hypothetical protein